MEHDVLVAHQFGSTARAYLESVTHATGEDLPLLGEEVAGVPDAAVLDLGCGAGHASFAMAPHAASVIAYDLTAQMLAVVKREATVRKLRNITTVQGMAEELPFPDARFDFVVTRTSAHHWHDVPAALREARRVLKPGRPDADDRHRRRRHPSARYASAGGRDFARSFPHPRLHHAGMAEVLRRSRFHRHSSEVAVSAHRVRSMDRTHAHPARARRCHSRYLEHRAG